MVGTRRFALFALLALVSAAMAGTASAAKIAEPTQVDGAVQVTKDTNVSRAHTVPVIAVDPRNERVLALAEADAYSSQCAVHVSTNAGLSWTQAARPALPSEYPNCSFVYFGPVVDLAFGADGTLFYALSGYNPTTKKGRVFLARSADLGATWETTALPWIAPNLDKGETGIDASPSIAVDPSDPKRVVVGWGSNWATYTLTPEVMGGKLYYWDVIERVYASVSNDGGRTFGEAVNVGEGLRLTPEAEGVKPPPQVLIGNRGEIHALFGEYSRAGSRDNREGKAPPAHVYLATSVDGGRTYDKRAIFTGPTPTATSDWTWVPRGGIDRHTDTFYVAWENMSSADDPVEISTMHSSDGGKTWSEPLKANDVPPKRKWNYPEAYPAIAVADSGRVDLAWYDGRNDPAYVDGARSNKFQDVYYTFSTDGGQSWAPNVRINDRIIDRNFGPSSQGGIRGPVGLAALDSAAYLAWDDSRNGRPENATQDIYFTRARAESGAGLLTAPAETSAVAWALLGAAITLAVGGLALVIVLTATRSRRATEPARQPAGTGVST
ncbi:MAG: sialidase family protein [Acidimicrobiales bacterium]